MMRWIGILFLLLTALTRVNAQQLTLEARAIERGGEYQGYFEEAGERYGVDPRLLWTISYLETRHNPKLISTKGARGLMQLMPATARRFGAANPFDPRQAIEAAAKYLAYLQHRFPGRLDLVLASYNAGETAVEAYKSGRSIQVGEKTLNPKALRTNGIPPYSETQCYVRAGRIILKNLGELIPFPLKGSKAALTVNKGNRCKARSYSFAIPTREFFEQPNCLHKNLKINWSLSFAATVEEP